MAEQYQPIYEVPPRGLSVAALVLGIIGLTLSIVPWCNWFIAVPGNILGVVFGAVAGQRAREGSYGGEQLAKAGFICGVTGLVIIGLWVLFFVLAGSFFANNPWSPEQGLWDEY